MIVVTAPTSRIGRQLVDRLLDGGAPLRVVARDPSRLAPRTRGRVEVVEGSHADAAVVEAAFAGADAVFWLVPADPRAPSVEAAYVDFTRPACDAVRRLGVRRVINVSALGRGLPVAARAGNVTASLATDDLIAGTGVDFRALTMPSFMDNVLRQVDAIRNRGVFFGPTTADLKLPTCATRDIADAAARLLLDPTWGGQGHVAVLGPEDLSFNDMARVASEVLGRRVRYEQVTLDAYRAGFLERGASEAMAQAMTDMASAKNAGLDTAEPRTPESTTPTMFRQWCEEVLAPAVGR